ncbi:MAG TPA: hypothetical protein VMR96_11670 [Solirubrobacterales bacterium]|nr:hypothetical protein [Solirubrobacterales bacterium]
MRLIDSQDGHLFALLPENVILLAPRRITKRMPVLLRFAPAPAPVSRSLVVHDQGGEQRTLVFVRTAAGWRRQT